MFINSSLNFCSAEHRTLWQSARQTHRLKTDVVYRQKLGTSSRSYMETSFESWVLSNFPQLTFIPQHPFVNENCNGTYYVDFFFPTLQLVIELDGNQHSIPKNKLHDEKRDAWITSTYNTTIIRITSKEYKSKTKMDDIASLLKM